MNKIYAVLLTLCLWGTSVGQAQPGEDQLTVSVTALKGALHLLQGRGGNVVASVGEDGILIVDDDYPQFAQAYLSALQSLAGQGSQPSFVVNTHWHGDHTGGNAFWGDRGAVIVAHSGVRQRMSTRQEMKALGRVVEPSPRHALPVVTYGDAMALHFNNDDIEIKHYSHGHTDGDSVIFFSKENVVHMGDHFFKDAFPFVDVGSGGNVFSFIANIEALLSRIDDNAVIVPGHGSLANRADLLRYYEMLSKTSAMVKADLERGMSVETIAEQGLGNEWADWGRGFINEAAWISFIAASL